jgi:glyoxylate/hydroxypyruvate reductase A
MTIKVLFSALPGRWEQYQEPLSAAFIHAGLRVSLRPDHTPETVDYVVYAPNGGLSDFTPFIRLKAVQCLWAGVETIVGNPTLRVPLARMVDAEGLTQGMVEWVTAHVLRHHIGMDAHILNPDHVWQPENPPLAPERPITILGLGALGTACGQALTGLGFNVTGWSRSPRNVQGIRCLHGSDGLQQALTKAEIIVTLLPDTPETTNIVNAKRLALLAKGAVVINPGRGPLIDDAALIASLNTGHISHATLDVFRTEPLPKDHPYWVHPRVTVTPHIAAETRPSSAAKIVAENLRRAEAQEQLLHLVDRRAGY